ncbi:baculoviral IAP repeat-containing protein 3-like [Ornithodoros turicata]|uniref:baculoviral IAP repeat-containing protein 3-like n=1 Tax=Ornithodoros turicata TaxID=34597 RepID=UPI003139B3BB
MAGIFRELLSASQTLSENQSATSTEELRGNEEHITTDAHPELQPTVAHVTRALDTPEDNDTHVTASPDASLSEPTSTVMMDAATEMKPELAYRTEDVCGKKYSYHAPPESHGSRVKEYAVLHTRPIHERYASFSSRKSSFDLYPATAKGNTEKMAKAGFFYTGAQDRTTCFQCGNSFCSWSDEDDPLSEHARWYRDCPYVILQLGDEVIENIRREHSNTLAEVIYPPPAIKLPNLEESSESSACTTGAGAVLIA